MIVVKSAFGLVLHWLRRSIQAAGSERTNPIARANCREIERLLQCGQSLVFVSSYPRSGNTWLRHLLTDVFLQLNGYETTTELSVHPDELIPDRYVNPIDAANQLAWAPSVFVKTHDRIEHLQGLSGGQSRHAAHLYMYRNPEDALVSYYHFHMRYDHLKRRVIDDVDTFCLSNLEGWIRHVSGYVDAVKKGQRMFLISYENMLVDPLATTKALFSFLNIDVGDAMLQRAISNTQFCKLRDREARDPINDEEYFFRKGVKGGGETELQQLTLDRIRSETGPLRHDADRIAGSHVAGSVAATD